MGRLKKVEGVASFYSFDGPGDNTTPAVHLQRMNDKGQWAAFK